MTVVKMRISLDANLGEDVRQAARRAGQSGLAETAAAKLRAEALGEFLDEWRAEHGPLTPEELGCAEMELGVRRRAPAT